MDNTIAPSRLSLAADQRALRPPSTGALPRMFALLGVYSRITIVKYGVVGVHGCAVASDAEVTVTRG